MSTSYSVTETIAFTVTHARHLATKVGTDLKRLQRFYGAPGDSTIDDFEGELVGLLKGGYMGKVAYGFRRGDKWIEPTLTYTARELVGVSGDDNDPGKVRPGADISGAYFTSYLTRSSAWDLLTPEEKTFVESTLPVKRVGAPEPGMSGYFVSDLTYSAGGRSLGRSSLRSY